MPTINNKTSVRCQHPLALLRACRLRRIAPPRCCSCRRRPVEPGLEAVGRVSGPGEPSRQGAFRLFRSHRTCSHRVSRVRGVCRPVPVGWRMLPREASAGDAAGLSSPETGEGRADVLPALREHCRPLVNRPIWTLTEGLHKAPREGPAGNAAPTRRRGLGSS